MIIIFYLIIIIKNMFDIKFYRLLKLTKDYHNNINDYNQYKDVCRKDEYVNIFCCLLAKLGADFELYNQLDLYNRLSYCYFKNYDTNVLQKQINQVKKNNRKVKKNDFAIL